MIQNPILKVLSVMRSHRVQALLMGGQACVFYGAAEFSRDIDILLLAEPGALNPLLRSLRELKAECIAVPPFSADYLRRGLGSAMTKYLVDWAKAQGWERIEGSAFLKGDWGWLPNIEFWEKAGFTRGTKEKSTLEFGPSIGFRMDLKSKP